MSVESKIYIVAPSNQRNKEVGKYWAETLAVFNLGYVDELQDVNKRYKQTSYYIYADDGDTEILEDKYGDELTELTLDQLMYELTIMDGKVAVSRRAATLLSALLTIRKNYDDGDILCLHYGY